MSALTGKEKMVLSGGTASKRFWQRTLDLTDSERPHIVIDTTAAPTDDYRQQLKNVTGQQLAEIFGVTVTLLNPRDGNGNRTDSTYAANLIATADILYPCGGDTKALLDEWHETERFTQVDAMLKAGKLTVAGASAGSLIWFERGFSDYRQYGVAEGEPWNYATLRGHGLLPGWGNVHHSDLKGVRPRRSFMEDTYRHAPGTGNAIGLESHAGIRIEAGTLTALDLRPVAAFSDAPPLVYHYENNRQGSRRIVTPGEIIDL